MYDVSYNENPLQWKVVEVRKIGDYFLCFLDPKLWFEPKEKQARRTAMHRSNVGNSWNREKFVFTAVYRSLAGKKSKHSFTNHNIDGYSLKSPSW